MDDKLEKIKARNWFYRFNLPDGTQTSCYLPSEVELIHPTRLKMMFSILEPLFQNKWENVSVIDLACHQGFFSLKLAQMGCTNVIGIDAREENIRDANLIRDAYGLDNLHFVHRDIHKLDPSQIGKFEITIMFGLIYHLEDPIGALKIARSLTTRVCLVETQIIPNLSGMTDWGSCLCPKEIVGTFGIIDETLEVCTHNREASVTGISLCPSLPGLVWIMKALGFSRVELVSPPKDAYEQFAYGKRVMVAGYIDA